MEQKEVENQTENKENISLKEKKGYANWLKKDKHFFVACLIFFFVTAIIAYFSINSQKSSKITVITEEAPADQNASLPENLQVLKNSAFKNWGARVKGKVVDVKEKQITIVPIKESFLPGERNVEVLDANDKTNILLVPNSTKFYLSEGETAREINYMKIPPDSVLEGNVEILYQNDSVTLYGKSLSIRK